MGSFGPRTYFVGLILSALIQREGLLSRPSKDLIDEAIRIADLTLERMQWPDGRPESHFTKSDE